MRDDLYRGPEDRSAADRNADAEPQGFVDRALELDARAPGGASGAVLERERSAID